MSPLERIELPDAPSEGERAALLNLLADEDVAVYQTVRQRILACGPSSLTWLRPHARSSEPVLRRRALELITHFDRQAADNRFLAFCLRHGEDFDLEEGIWLLAQTRYPHFNPDGYRALLDFHARELKERLEFIGEAKQVLSAINRYLFEELRFGGNEENYYDPESSYLNRVLDRRKGNPISLCQVYLLLARRLRLPMAGIGLPGHFVCRYQSSEMEIYVDAFNRGKFLTKADCVHYLQQANYSLREEYLAPVTPRRLLLRVCGNLHQIYEHLELEDEVTRLQRYRVALSR